MLIAAGIDVQMVDANCSITTVVDVGNGELQINKMVMLNRWYHNKVVDCNISGLIIKVDTDGMLKMIRIFNDGIFKIY